MVKWKKTTINLLISAFTEMKGKFNLENVAKEFQYTKDTMGLCRNTDLQCNWKEFESDKALQEENIKGILDGLDPSCVAAFTDGSALGNPGPTGAGAVISNPSCARYWIKNSGKIPYHCNLYPFCIKTVLIFQIVFTCIN